MPWSYATFDHQTTVIAADVLTNADTEDEYARGNNRYLSPVVGFPSLTVPAGLTDDGLPIGLEFLAGPFAEAALLRLGYAYEQGTLRRERPATTPALKRSGRRAPLNRVALGAGSSVLPSAPNWRCRRSPPWERRAALQSTCERPAGH